ncbi:MAG: competence protein CoiA family protein [Promethearchaeota archaeon]
MVKDKKILHAFNFELGKIYNVLNSSSLKYDKYTWLCTICKKPLFYDEELGSFLHAGNRNYCFEPETIEHKIMKAYWYLMFPKFNSVIKKKVEFIIGDQVADVYFELSNGNKVVIECQNSQISKRKLIERTKKYSNKNIYVLWIFNGLGSCVSDQKYPRNEEEKGVLGMEKRVHSLYGGRVYYMNVEGKKIIDSPFVLHFTPFFKHKSSEYNYYGYNKYYKGKRSLILGKIPNYKIFCIDVKGYKLARFSDKHVSTLCSEDLKEIIKEICQKSLKNGKTIHDEISISLSLIGSSLKNKYGFHLPYILLKNSNKIKTLSFEKSINNYYKIENLIRVRISDYL